MVYFSALFDVGQAITHAFRTLAGIIATLIYDGVAWAYDLFTYIARAEILDNDFVNEIYRKVGLILGLFMTFKLIFTLIQSLIDPNKFSDNQKGFGPVIVRCIVSIVLLGVTPTIFREAFEIQNLIVGNENSDNVIYKLIVGTVPSNDASSFGKVLSTEMFFSFYQDEVSPFINNTSINWDEIGEVDIDELNSVDNIKKTILEGRSFSYARSYLGVQTNRTYVIEFDELFCIAVGAVLFYLLIIYCIQTAIRVFQLAYLQLIAPVPILSYISNPDGAFKKWIKQCTTTFLDLFIRLAIIYFVVALSSEIFDQLNNANSILMLSLRDASSSLITWVKVFLIIGLLLFAKKVPELLKDLFPNLGGGAASLSMGLQSPKKLWQDTLSKTPVGWAAGLGKTAIGYMDRKIHHLPKPRSKVGQWVDKVAPGHAEMLKNKRQAIETLNVNQRNEKLGRELYKKYGDKLPAGAFKHTEYQATYTALNEAGKSSKQANDEYRREYENYQRAYRSGDREAIRVAESRLKTAEANKKAMEGKLELAQKNHDANKKRYTRDAEVESRYNYYKKTHQQLKNYDDEEYNYDANRSNSSPTSPEPRTVRPEPVPPQQVYSPGQVTNSGIEIAMGSRPRPSEPNSGPSGMTPQQEYDDLVKRYDAEGDAQKKAEIKKQIEDFERKH